MSIHTIGGVDLGKIDLVILEFKQSMSKISRNSTESQMVKLFVSFSEKEMVFHKMYKTAFYIYPDAEKILKKLVSSFDGDRKYNRALIIGAKQVLISQGRW